MGGTAFDLGVVPKQLHAELHSIDQKVPTKPCFEEPLQWYDAADYRHFRTASGCATWQRLNSSIW